MTTTIDFSGRPPPRHLGWILAAIGLAVLGWQAWSTWQLNTETQRERQGLEQLVAQASRPASGSGMSLRDQRRHVQIERLSTYLAAPWEELLQVFESHAGRAITVLRLEPDAQSGVVRMTGEAQTLTAVMGYVSALENEPRLSQVLLTRHQVQARASKGTEAPSPASAAASDAIPAMPTAGGATEFTVTALWRRPAAVAAAATPEGRP